VAIKCPSCHSDNPDTLKFCGECGTQLPLPKGHPPVLTETLQTPIRELATGSTFAGRYQVIEELGHGGMGRVYKVFDTKIKEKVALKLIKPEIASDKETIERFGNELRLARKISQRNVCRMFDIGEAEGAHFITMEYVHGEDLKSMIRMSGSLSVGMLLSVGKQVCDGLAEAHSLGVVHRDLKPQNIMIDKSGNAKIMDFGIARSVKDKGITGAGVMIGTPEYMSPEQVEAKEVDHRSDIYSLGVILYEMATSHVPFSGETALSIAMKHKGEIPKNPKQLSPGIPDDLSGVILKCLEKDRAKRYQSASDVHSELEKIEMGIPTTERVVPERKTITSREITLKFTPKRLLVPGLVFLALIAAGIILWRIIPSKRVAPSPSALGQPILAVLYFENKSGDTKLDYLREVLAELINIDLSQSRFIRVVTGEEMYTILKRLGLADARKYSSEDIEKIAAQTLASYVLRGSFIKAGEGFIITAGLQKPGTTESPAPLRLEASNEKDIVVKVDELTRQVKEGLNLTAAQIATDFEKEAGKITTSSPEALKYYVEGRKHHMKLEYEQELACMEKAVELDPEFALAYKSMVGASNYTGHPADARKYLKKALELSDRLPENQRLQIEGDQFYYDEEYAKAIDTYERLIKAYPEFTSGHWGLGLAYALAGEMDKTIEQYEFVAKNLRTPITVGNLAEGYNALGLYQKSEDLCRSFLQDVEDNFYVRNGLKTSYLLRRKFDLALAEAEKEYLLRPDYQPEIGDVLLLKGDIAGAERVYKQVYEKYREMGRNCLYNLALLRGKYQDALDLTQQNLEESKGNIEKEAGAYGWVSAALEKAGRYEEAYKAEIQYLQLSAEYRKSVGESGSPYLPSQQKDDLGWKGIIQAEIRSFDEARKTAEELKSLIEKGINMTELRNYEYILGLVEYGKKDYRKAADHFGSACGRLDFEGDAQFFNSLARSLFESGDLDKARREYEKIVLQTAGRLRHGDIYAKAFYMLGKIAEKQGDIIKARENYRKFLDLWKDADAGLPEVADAKKRLAAL
jgi:serine/threonine protein kinase/Tfp pilus assembly protein PilF